MHCWGQRKFPTEKLENHNIAYFSKDVCVMFTDFLKAKQNKGEIRTIRLCKTIESQNIFLKTT